MTSCPNCNEDCDDYTTYNNISPYGGRFKCPSCGTSLQCEYDESYDPETGEESNYYWLSIDDDKQY